MSMLLQTLPSRRHSRRRARVVRARMLFFCIALLLAAYTVWPPTARTNMEAAAIVAAPREAEPEQSIDTEGALEGGRQASDAALYAAER